MTGKVDVWFVYIVQCVDDTLYTGVAKNINKRLYEHNHTARGARYTRGRRPVRLVYSEPAADRSQACRREYAIKQFSRQDKIHLIGG